MCSNSCSCYVTKCLYGFFVILKFADGLLSLNNAWSFSGFLRRLNGCRQFSLSISIATTAWNMLFFLLEMQIFLLFLRIWFLSNEDENGTEAHNNAQLDFWKCFFRLHPFTIIIQWKRQKKLRPMHVLFIQTVNLNDNRNTL